MSARVLSAMVVLLVCTGCAQPTQLPTPMSTRVVACAMCEDLAPRSAPELVVPYIKNKYPEQGIAEVDPRRLNQRSDSTQQADIWSGGDWVIEDFTETSSGVGKVIVTNTATGFRWEGQVTEYQEAPSSECCNGLWYQKVVETSVELPAPGVLTGTRATRSPQPTPAIAECEVFQPLGDKGRIYAIEIGEDGAVWIAASASVELGNDGVWRDTATISGAARLDPESAKWVVFGESEGLPIGGVRFITPDKNGTAWLAFWGDPALSPRRNVPVYHFDGKKWAPFAGSPDFQAGYVTAISIAPDESVWFATNSGVYRWDRKAGAWEHYTEADGLHSNDVSEVLFTPDSKVWFSSIGGVSYLDQANLAGGSGAWWSGKDQSHTDRYDVATTSEDGKVWFGGQRYFDTVRQSWVETVYLYGSANDIAVDGRGGLWIGTESGAIYIPDPDNSSRETWQPYSAQDGIGGNSISRLAIQGDDILWFGAGNGTVSRCRIMH